MVSLNKQPKVAIVGLGNVLLTDDGVGVHVLRQLQRDPPAGVTLAEIGTAVLDALDVLEDADLVIAVDAVISDPPPGSVYCFDGCDILNSQTLSGHELGLCAALQYMPVESRPQVIILGVESAVIAYGMDLSPVVSRAIPHVIETIGHLVHEIRQSGASSKRKPSFLSGD